MRTILGWPAPAPGVGQGAKTLRDARVGARGGRLVGSAKLSCCFGGSGPGQGWAPAVPFLRLAYLVLHSSEPEPRELKQRPYSPLFRFHLLRLLLLPPATRRHNRFRLAGVPRKEERGRGEHRV